MADKDIHRRSVHVLLIHQRDLVLLGDTALVLHEWPVPARRVVTAAGDALS